jgi:hypothetical protein
MRRRRHDDEVTCVGAPTCETEDHRTVHHFGCPRWDVCETPSWGGLRPHKVFLGSPRTPYAKWAKTVSLYTWPLWRNWTPKPRLKVETAAEVQARHMRQKPHYHVPGCSCISGGDQTGCATYPWKVEKLTPEQRVRV